MNIINTLTLRHIKIHKKRSILTVLAIIVSVAMVTAVFTSAISFVKFFQNATKAVDGDWHAKFVDDDYSAHKAFFATDENIDQFGARGFLGSASPENAKENSYVNIFCAEKNWFELRSVKVSQGRLPQNSREILLTKQVIDGYALNTAVGDKITLLINNAENKEPTPCEYEVVGISDSRVSATDSFAVFTGFDSESLKASSETVVLARYNKLDNSIWDKMSDTAESVGISSYGSNRDLFNYSGIMRNNDILYSLAGFAGILLLIIAVVSVFMIYDSFAVSYQERERHLGMLASVGATKRQKRMSIYFEGFILGLIGIPIGLASGIVGIAVTFKCVEKAFLSTMAIAYDGALRVYVNPIVIIGTIIASAVTIFISAYIPARKASKTTAIEAIRQSNTVKVKKAKRLRTSKLVNKIFGYEGVIAVKNYKRNGKRSRNIVFALSLSVIVFLTVANFSTMLSDAMNMSYVSSPDLYVSSNFTDREAVTEVIKAAGNIERFFTDTSEYSELDAEYFIDGYEDQSIMLVFLDNESFNDYLKQLHESPAYYHDKSAPAAILYNSVPASENNRRTKKEPVKRVEGQKIPVTAVEGYDEGIMQGKEFLVKIGVQTTVQWREEKFNLYASSVPLVILSEDFIDVMFEENPEIPMRTSVNIICSNPESVSKEIFDIMNEKHEDIEFFITQPGAGLQSMNNFLSVVKVFIYGFITLITIISVMNIINTISNSMNERRREFAMIRSVGMTPKSFKKMIYLEALRYGGKALLFSIPIGILIHFAMYKALSQSFDTGFKINLLPYLAAAIAVFAIIGISLIYSIDKIRNDNIIETLKADIN